MLKKRTKRKLRWFFKNNNLYETPENCLSGEVPSQPQQVSASAADKIKVGQKENKAEKNLGEVDPVIKFFSSQVILKVRQLNFSLLCRHRMESWRQITNQKLAVSGS